jgi:hypothetical protein
MPQFLPGSSVAASQMRDPDLTSNALARTCSGVPEAQLYAIPRRVLQKKLMDAEFRYMAAGKPDVLPIQARFHLQAVRAGKSDMVKSRGYVRETRFARPRFAKMKNAVIAGIKPVSKAFQTRPLALPEADDITIKIPEPFHEFAWGPQVVVIEGYRCHSLSSSRCHFYSFAPLDRNNSATSE